MKILVIDDCRLNTDAAIAQLGNKNEVVVANSYEEGDRLLMEFPREPNTDYDIVLVDLLMPVSMIKQGPKGLKYAGQEMPIGIFLALLAATRGVKRVILLTDTGHHDHPASACIDSFNSILFYQGRNTIKVGEAELVLCNTGFVEEFDPGDLATPLDWRSGENLGSVEAKNWKGVIEKYLKEE